MPTSNSTNWTRTKQDVIKVAFFHIGKYANGRTIEAEDYFIASQLLNDMIKEWEPDLHLWTKTEGIVHLTQYVGEYNLGSYSYFTKRENQITRQLAAAYAATDTIITLDSTEDFSVIGTTIGIVLDNGTTHWTTIANINVDGITLTLTNALPSSASAENLVYYFTASADKPLRILDARLLHGYDATSSSTQLGIPMSVIAYEDYWNLVNTSLNGQVPNQYCYNPKSTEGTFYIWPRPTSTAYRIQVTYERILEDLDNLSDTVDFPQEWFSALHYQLAVRLAPGYGKSDRLPYLAPLASTMLENAKDKDNELAYVKFSPSMDGSY